MTKNSLDVLAIGNAIVDVLAHADDEALNRLGLPKGGMQLIEQADIAPIYEAMGPAQQRSGGSAANTVAGIASLGGKAGFIGRVADDDFGKIFAHDIQAVGVEFNSAPVTHAEPTARCLIFVTPDGQRTMNTYLGCSPSLDRSEITQSQIARADILYLEGYLYDRPEAQAAFDNACAIAATTNTRIALSLSDTFCVERHRQAFTALIETHVDILFANEHEIAALTSSNNVRHAAEQLAGEKRLVAMTCGAQGSYVFAGGSENAGSESHHILSHPVEEVVDTTGAGDLYAAGFLYGLAQGHKIETCGRLGSIAAAEVIGHMGARPKISLRKLVESQKL
ncbi:MAG: adenosine kinase [Pseudomonadota bacterium]